MDNAPLPHWLAPTAHQAIQPVEHHIDNPVDPSLVPPLIPTALLDPQERRRLSKELLDATFDSMFERVLTEITRGRTLKSIVAEDLRNIDYEAFCQVHGSERGTDDGSISSLTVEDFDTRRQAGESFHLLDVREPHEFEIVRIPGSTPFPLSELPARLHELDSATTYTLHCHRGTRSLQAYLLMRKAGFGRLQILSGGVDAWAARIDRSLPRY